MGCEAETELIYIRGGGGGGGGCACAIHLKANELIRPSYLDGGVSQPYFYIRLTQRRAKRHQRHHPARPVERRQRVAKHDDMHAPDHTTTPSLIYSKVWTIMPCKETSRAAKSKPTTRYPEYAYSASADFSPQSKHRRRRVRVSEVARQPRLPRLV